MNKSVYTVIIGNNVPYHLKRPTVKNKSWDHICFTDNPKLKDDFWEIRLIENHGLDNRRESRRPKCLNDEYLKHTDVSLFLDTRYTINCNLDELVDTYLGEKDIAIGTAAKRHSVYEEAEYCIRKGVGKEKEIKAQIDRYRKEGYEGDNGLFPGGIIFRKHCIENQNMFMQKWFYEIENGCDRDMISFPYVLWKIPLNISFFSFKLHRKLMKRS